MCTDPSVFELQLVVMLDSYSIINLLMKTLSLFHVFMFHIYFVKNNQN